MISESIKKVEHADFVGLLAKDPVDENLVHGKVGKNRSGKSNVAIDFKVDFSRFKYVSANTVAIRKESDGTKKSKSNDSCVTKKKPFGGGVSTLWVLNWLIIGTTV